MHIVFPMGGHQPADFTLLIARLKGQMKDIIGWDKPEAESFIRKWAKSLLVSKADITASLPYLPAWCKSFLQEEGFIDAPPAAPKDHGGSGAPLPTFVRFHVDLSEWTTQEVRDNLSLLSADGIRSLDPEQLALVTAADLQKLAVNQRNAVFDRARSDVLKLVPVEMISEMADSSLTSRLPNSMPIRDWRCVSTQFNPLPRRRSHPSPHA